MRSITGYHTAIKKAKDRNIVSRKGAKYAKMDENDIGKEIVDAAIAVHRELGPAE